VALTGCDSRETGALAFRANGEDFVREGFIDKQGWSITFDTLLVNLSDITAYNSRDGLTASLPGERLVDLAAGDSNAQPLSVGLADSVATGVYQSLSFRVSRAASGPYTGYSIVMIGSAEKDARIVPFRILLDEQMRFDGKEGYVGDEVKGVVKKRAVADVEMTFHFDHIFGDGEAAADDHINAGATGFDFFYGYAESGLVDITQRDLQDGERYPTLIRSLWSLGHLGEGHCDVSETTTAL
jgi:hypothetical protein